MPWNSNARVTTDPAAQYAGTNNQSRSTNPTNRAVAINPATRNQLRSYTPRTIPDSLNTMDGPRRSAGSGQTRSATGYGLSYDSGAVVLSNSGNGGAYRNARGTGPYYDQPAMLSYNPETRVPGRLALEADAFSITPDAQLGNPRSSVEYASVAAARGIQQAQAIASESEDIGRTYEQTLYIGPDRGIPERSSGSPENTTTLQQALGGNPPQVDKDTLLRLDQGNHVWTSDFQTDIERITFLGDPRAIVGYFWGHQVGQTQPATQQNANTTEEVTGTGPFSITVSPDGFTVTVEGAGDNPTFGGELGQVLPGDTVVFVYQNGQRVHKLVDQALNNTITLAASLGNNIGFLTGEGFFILPTTSIEFGSAEGNLNPVFIVDERLEFQGVNITVKGTGILTLGADGVDLIMRRCVINGRVRIFGSNDWDQQNTILGQVQFAPGTTGSIYNLAVVGNNAQVQLNSTAGIGFYSSIFANVRVPTNSCPNSMGNVPRAALSLVNAAQAYSEFTDFVHNIIAVSENGNCRFSAVGCRFLNNGVIVQDDAGNISRSGAAVYILNGSCLTDINHNFLPAGDATGRTDFINNAVSMILQNSSLAIFDNLRIVGDTDSIDARVDSEDRQDIETTGSAVYGPKNSTIIFGQIITE